MPIPHVYNKLIYPEYAQQTERREGTQMGQAQRKKKIEVIEPEEKRKAKPKKPYRPFNLDASYDAPPPDYSPGNRCKICNKPVSGYNKKQICFHHTIDELNALLAEEPPKIVAPKERPADREVYTTRRSNQQPQDKTTATPVTVPMIPLIFLKERPADKEPYANKRSSKRRPNKTNRTGRIQHPANKEP